MSVTGRIWAVPIALVAAVPMLARPLDAEEKVVFEKDIEYTNPDDQHLQLDMARPDGAGPYPAVGFIYGGGFCGGARPLPCRSLHSRRRISRGHAPGLRRPHQEVREERIRRSDGHVPARTEVS